jgi:integrase/recombinase XerD
MEHEHSFSAWPSSIDTPQGHPDTLVVSEYLHWQDTVRRRSSETLRSYRSTLMAWLAWLDGKPLCLTTLQDLEAFQVRPRTKRGHGGTGAAATQRREVAAIRLFYRWATSRGHLEADPMREALAPTVKARQPRPIADGVWLKAWDADMPTTLRAAVGLGFFCGLRRAEVVSLTVDQLTDRRIVEFVRKGGGEDTLPWRTLVEVYETHLPHLQPERFVEALNKARRHGAYLTPFRDPAWMNRTMHRHGLPFTPHQLRHSCATNLIRSGVPLPIVSRMMNHSSITTTMLYVKAGGDELHDWLRPQRGT